MPPFTTKYPIPDVRHAVLDRPQIDTRLGLPEVPRRTADTGVIAAEATRKRARGALRQRQMLAATNSMKCGQ